MRNYDRVYPRKPAGIEERNAYIVGGGIAGLSAAAFLVRDAQMPGGNITVYDQLPVFGGSMDCAGASETGYVSRGERELEPYMECLWDLFGNIPSLYEEGRTVLDETRECKKTGRSTPSTACESRASVPTTNPPWASPRRSRSR